MTNDIPYTPPRQNWTGALAVYADRRMAKIFFIGFISGFPWLLIASMLSLWLKEEGLSRSGIGLFGLVFSVYAVNALWSPLIDGLKIPFLTRWFGARRAWILLMQGVILLALLGLYFLPDSTATELPAGATLVGIPLAWLAWLNITEPNELFLWTIAILIFIIALASATQDIAIDATRIEMFGEDEPDKVGGGSAMATSGWWAGFGGGKVFAFLWVDYLQASGVINAWQVGYVSLTVVVALCMLGVIAFLPNADRDKTPDDAIARAPLFIRPAQLFIQPVLVFIRRYTLPVALTLLFFIFFFKIGEAFLGRMSLVFYKEVGFSKSEIGLLSGGLGTLTVCAFAIFGGFINARYGLFRGLLLGGIAMAATNLLFAALAYHPEKWLFATAVISDQFTTAVSTVAFVAFISQLCDRNYTATHYAALGSLGNLSRTTLAASSGILVDGLGGNWPVFFVITVAMVVPSLLILLFLRRPLSPILQGGTTGMLRA